MFSQLMVLVLCVIAPLFAQNNDDPIYISEGFPAQSSLGLDLAYLSDQSSVICWSHYDLDNFKNYVYVQIIDDEHKKNGDSFIANTVYSEDVTFPRIKPTIDGNFIVIWGAISRGDVTDYGIYAQKFSPEGIKIGETVRISDEDHILSTQTLYTFKFQNNNIAICWEDYGVDVFDFSDSGIYMQILDDELQKELSVARRICRRDSITNIDIFAINDSQICVVSQTSNVVGETVYYRVWRQVVDVDGNTLKELTLISPEPTKKQLNARGLALSNNSYVITWHESPNGVREYDVWSQRYSSITHEKIGEKFIVNQNTEAIQAIPTFTKLTNSFLISFASIQFGRVEDFEIRAIELNNEGNVIGDEMFLKKIIGYPENLPPFKLIFNEVKNEYALCWSRNESPRTAGDLYLQFFPEDFTSEVFSNPQPINFSLGNNYPNPFNESTIIEYQIQERAWVKLNIYNINGQLIDTILNKYQNEGTYKLNWSGVNHASGIYMLELTAGGHAIQKKMILLK